MHASAHTHARRHGARGPVHSVRQGAAEHWRAPHRCCNAGAARCSTVPTRRNTARAATQPKALATVRRVRQEAAEHGEHRRAQLALEEPALVEPVIRAPYSDYPYPLLRLSVPVIPIIRTHYSDYPYPLFRLSVPSTRYSDYPYLLFRLSVPLIPIIIIRTAYSDYPYPLFRLSVRHILRTPVVAPDPYSKLVSPPLCG